MAKHQKGQFCFKTPKGKTVCSKNRKTAQSRMQTLGFKGLKITFGT